MEGDNLAEPRADDHGEARQAAASTVPDPSTPDAFLAGIAGAGTSGPGTATAGATSRGAGTDERATLAAQQPRASSKLPMLGDHQGSGRVLVVAGTHGNESNGPWLLEQLQRQPNPCAGSPLQLELVIGNPAARAAGRRYLERDLNRSFDPHWLQATDPVPLEVERARQLLGTYGPDGHHPCLVALDLHSTTAAMGNSLVVYGRRPMDLALAASLQQQLGLPIYLHEGDARQTGYLVERWPCGLVIEVGPVPQGVLLPAIVQQSRLALEQALVVLLQAAENRLRLPQHVVVHRHLGSLDLPRQGDGSPAALIHPHRQGRDWQPLHPGDPLFLTSDGDTVPYTPPPDLADQLADQTVWPVFINEAAYGEKGIALSLTQRQIWPVKPEWSAALIALAGRLQRWGD